MKTRRDIENLKRTWLTDPLWDLEDTEGFEAHEAELREFRLATESRWKAAGAEREAALDAEAEQLGVHGLFRLMRGMEAVQRRHAAAVGHLTDGKPDAALRALHGDEDA